MHKYVKKIVAATLGVVMFSALTAGYVYADDLTQYRFSKPCQAGTYCSVASPKGKTDRSDMFIHFDNSSVGSTYRVRAMAANQNGTTTGNYTLCEDVYVNYVICNKGKMYGIENEVYKNSAGYGVLQFYQNAGYGTTSGYWAVATSQEYDNPVAPW